MTESLNIIPAHSDIAAKETNWIQCRKGCVYCVLGGS